jgi:hypothetical protein
MKKTLLTLAGIMLIASVFVAAFLDFSPREVELGFFLFGTVLFFSALTSVMKWSYKFHLD